MKLKSKIIEDLIEHFGGTQENLATALKISQGTVTGWLNMKHGVSELNAQKIEKLTNGKFKAIDLCPRLAEIEKLKTPSGN
ncbi:Cro/CI family transcriptional regulator [Moraxella sp. VT-16-12]|uniref:transcriptional regulator n=1 Tax=Moraxella sp. VT-16-12 TaxID=2014877 RepID=UPI000B7E945F|nr:Cro/CI family transcriptional regulator [Moraxella sp. VT-16-12]TWV81530.1 helix-turn-helix domain-containing protein [Moraxella sp. VT-16-12]